MKMFVHMKCVKDYIKYPMFNIGYDTWNLDVLGDFFIYDIVYKGNNDFFEEYYFNQNFIDCNWNIFRIIGKSPIKQSLFTWNRKKSQLEFEFLHKKMELHELKKILLDRSMQIKDQAAYKNASKTNIRR